MNLIKRYANFRNLYVFILLVMVVNLPLSKFLASAAQISLVMAWLIEGKFSQKWFRFKSNPQILVFMILFFVPLLGMTYTEDFKFGVHDLQMKLPLLILPVVLGTINPLNKSEMRIILGGFVLAVIAGALISVSIMLGIGPIPYTTDRETILFISHIRFALMVVLAVFILFYFAFDPKTPLHYKLILVLCALSLVIFLFLLKSLTGVVILFVSGMILTFRWELKQSDILVRWFVIVGLAAIPVLAAFYLTDQVRRFYTIRDSASELELATVKGNPYSHDTSNMMIENGYHVGFNLCEPELRDAWNRVSKIDYSGSDLKGQELRYTLIRYMTSLGLRKDAFGVSQLKAEDIFLIEGGFANCIYKQPKRFSVRIYETIWEIDQYRKGGNPSGHSVTQRFEFIKTGWAIFRDHPVFGVGTGDTQIAFDRKYLEMNSQLYPAWRFRAHNQFLTFLISFGVIGFVLLISAMIFPLIVRKRKNSYFVIMFFLVSMLSMLNEDTLETQAGVAFFAIFYCLFVFADATAATTDSNL
ncbi:MAG: O-antigen ligase family protein [Bacteroidia bacterium]|nr:O-antigen ligase family protein [Bacteroidia bacterium]